MAILAAITIITVIPVNGICIMAENVEKNVDDMTLEELKVAYLKLQLEYEKLKSSVENKSEDNSADDNNKNAVEAEGLNQSQNQSYPVLMDEEEFKTDIVNSYNGRSIISDKYTTAEINIMTSNESVIYYEECAEAERQFYEKYKNASFADLNIQYLCNQYITGLQKQYNAKNIWNDTNNYDKFNNEYESGYYNRAYVIVELSEYYNLAFGDIASMKEDTAYMDSLNEAETRNSSVDHATIKKVQELLNGIGFYCGNADGVSGKRTVKSIKRFQEMYGYEPEDGIIDTELVKELQNELDKK